LLAVLTLSATEGPYACTTTGAEISAADVHDVHLRLRGPLRLAHVGFSG
jgi:beta-glucosidase